MAPISSSQAVRIAVIALCLHGSALAQDSRPLDEQNLLHVGRAPRDFKDPDGATLIVFGDVAFGAYGKAANRGQVDAGPYFKFERSDAVYIAADSISLDGLAFLSMASPGKCVVLVRTLIVGEQGRLYLNANRYRKLAKESLDPYYVQGAADYVILYDEVVFRADLAAANESEKGLQRREVIEKLIPEAWAGSDQKSGLTLSPTKAEAIASIFKNPEQVTFVKRFVYGNAKPSMYLPGMEENPKPKSFKWHGLDAFALAGAVHYYYEYDSKSDRPRDIEPLIIRKGIAQSAQRYVPNAVLDAWRVLSLEGLEAKIVQAAAANKRENLLPLVARARDLLSDLSGVSQEYRGRMTRVAQSIEEIRSKVFPAVLRESVAIGGYGGSSHRLLQFREGESLAVRLAPTHALAVPRRVGNREMLGVVQRHPDKPLVQISFDAQLSVDPMLVSLLNSKLNDTGQSVTGMFNSWTLSSAKIDIEGVVDHEVRILGDTVQFLLTLDADQGILALWRLGTGAGVPLTFEYACNADERVRGSLVVPVALNRRTTPSVIIREGLVTNIRDAAVTVDYFMQNGRAVPLNPALEVMPGLTNSVKLPIDPTVVVSTAKIDVPPHAVAIAGRVASSLEEFDLSQAGGLLETVELQNLISSVDNVTNLSLDYIEVTLACAAHDSAGAATVHAGPYRLSPRGADGSTVRAHFIRRTVGKNWFTVEGYASYDNGRSRRDIKFGPHQDLVTRLDERAFVQPSKQK